MGWGTGYPLSLYLLMKILSVPVWVQAAESLHLIQVTGGVKVKV